MPDTKWTILYRDKEGEVRRSSNGSACFSPFPDHVRSCAKKGTIEMVEYDLAKQYFRREHIFHHLSSEQTINLVRDLYSDEIGINRWLLSDAESTIQTGKVLVSPEADGRVVVNTLSFFRQFMEHAPAFYQNYINFRNVGADPLEAYVLGSCYQISQSFYTGFGNVATCNFSAHGVMHRTAASKAGYRKVRAGMQSQGRLEQFPRYRDRDSFFRANSDPVRLKSMNTGDCLAEWRKVVNG